MHASTKNTMEQTNSSATFIFHRLREACFLGGIAISVFLLLSLVTYHTSDPAWTTAGLHSNITNAGGKIGAYIADLLLYCFGYVAYGIPVILSYFFWQVCFVSRKRLELSKSMQYFGHTLRAIGFLLIVFSACSLTNINVTATKLKLSFGSGGVIGHLTSVFLLSELNLAGATLILVVSFLVGVTLLTGLSWLKLAEWVGKKTCLCLAHAFAKIRQIKLPVFPKRHVEDQNEEGFAQKPSIIRPEKVKKKIPPKIIVNPVAPSEPTETAKKLSKLWLKKEKESKFNPALAGTLPPLHLLDAVDKTKKQGYTNQQLQSMSQNLEVKLKEFAIIAAVVAVHPGPVVTRFELELAAGTKVSKISALAKDLARSLSALSVRIVEVIPGKSVIGLEVPNVHREIVRLREILGSEQYQRSHSPLALGLGKDIAGHSVIADLAKMPHLLVAGTTGSGKSVGLNAIILSFLYRCTPEQLRVIMIDPKMLELSVYDGIPHLLTPVVTDMKDANNALRWCVAEMERRYKLMASLGVRNLAGFNRKIIEARKKGAPLLDPLWQKEAAGEPDELKTLPFIVVIVDEFADMMMIVGKKVEELIARIAQKARAAGIHLVLATQRPSVDVITGLIKANIPTRIAFQVSSKIDSRTILDQQGAEQLLGYGDMLYLPPGTGVPVRVHGAYVADDEVHRVVQDIKQRGEPDYQEEILQENSTGDPVLDNGTAGIEADGEQDPLYDQAVQIVIQTRRPSVSNIQRRLKIGYNRAARLVETMEQAGIVSPMESNGSREVLVPETEE